MVFKGPGPMKDIPMDDFDPGGLRDTLLDKLNFRVISISIVFPILLVIGLVAVYFVTDYRMDEKHGATVNKIDRISGDIDELKAFFSEQTSESKKSLMERIKRFKQTLNKIGADVAELKKQKTDKKTVDAIVKKEVGGIVDAVEALKGDTAKQQGAIEELAGSSSDQEERNSQQAKNLAASKSILDRLQERVEEQTTVIEALSDRTAKMQDSVARSHKERERLNEKIEFLELELEDSRNRIDPAGKASTKSPLSTESPPGPKQSNIKEETIE